METQVPYASSQSNSAAPRTRSGRTPSIPILAASALLLAILVGCNPLKPKPPALEQLLDIDSSVAGWWDVDAIPVDPEHFRNVWQQHQSAIEESVGEGLGETLGKLGLQPDDIAKVILAADAIDLDKDLKLEELLAQTPWILGVDLNGYLNADVLVFALNAQTKQTGLLARHVESDWKPFERVDVQDADGNALRFSIAIYPGDNSQLRIGQPERVMRSIHATPEDLLAPAEPMLKAEQFWLLLRTPEALTAQVREWEQSLPIDTGALLSGFESIRLGSQWDGQGLESVLSLEFEDPNGADTAYSILSLSHRFVIKPSLRKSIGEAESLIRSLQLERRGHQVHYRSRITPADAAVLQIHAERMHASPLIRVALDLIRGS